MFWLYHLYFFHLHQGLKYSVCLERPTGHCVPPARSGHRCVADSTNLYVFGGYNPDFEEAGGSENEDYPLFRELWRFHFATATWQQVRTEGYMPTELASMSGMDWCATGHLIRITYPAHIRLLLFGTSYWSYLKVPCSDNGMIMWHFLLMPALARLSTSAGSLISVTVH